MTRIINVAKDFSRYPAGRFVSDGPYSGEKFRTDFLLPVLMNNEHVIVHLDGTRGYGSSFLEEAFGGLVRLGFDKSIITSLISFESKDESLKFEIQDYLHNAK